MAVFWDVAPSSLVDIDRRFSGVSFLRLRSAVLHPRKTSHFSCMYLLVWLKTEGGHKEIKEKGGEEGTK
jgi:hypothetical protein